LRVKKRTGKHPKYDEHVRALYFNAAGQRITMAEHTNRKPSLSRALMRWRSMLSSG
jgi:hypothetical protein